MYPLRFQPIYRNYLWGGQRFRTLLGRSVGDADVVAESWEVVDHGADQSVVSVGPLAGRTLHELMRSFPVELLGRAGQYGEFPLLFKFLDANQALSVQVHPNDMQASQRDPPDRGKTEAWYVVHADPGSRIYAGLKRGFDRRAFEREVQRGTTELCLHRVEARAGDCFFIPAGVVHALGAGVVIAEIQQSSDTTFRLFDWNRTGPDGRPRTLHIDEALAVINFGAGPIEPQVARTTERAHVRRLVECDKFVWDRWQFSGREPVGGDGRCHLLAVVQGSVQVEGDAANRPLTFGESMLVPAACGAVSVAATEECVLLDAFLPLGD